MRRHLSVSKDLASGILCNFSLVLKHCEALQEFKPPKWRRQVVDDLIIQAELLFAWKQPSHQLECHAVFTFSEQAQ